jgi:ribosomal protein S18 acetylase RimI-like enzyme
MDVLTDLYRRGIATAVACWSEFSRGVRGASVEDLPGVTAAVFPTEPERSVYNNAVLARGLTAVERREAVDALEAVYASVGVERFAAWVHESDAAMCRDLEQRGYSLDTTTRAMGMALDDVRLPRSDVELGLPDWSEHLRLIDVPPGFLSGVDQRAFHVVVGRLEGTSVATGLAYDHDGDCGIYNVGTWAHARRRGLGTAVTTVMLRDAVARGCVTASLQSTEMAERMYASVGFQDLGRIFEYEPPALVSGSEHRPRFV